jgi:ParB family transcriptional regulator, chromosome partitioning protein
MSKQAVELKRGVSTFVARPEDLTVVRTSGHPLYQKHRVDLALDEAMVQSIYKHGVISPLVVRKNGKVLEIEDGRQRHANAIEANRRRVDEGLEPHMLPVIVKNMDDKDAALIAEMLNHNRQNDGPVAKAESALHLLSLNHSPQDICMALRITAPTLANYKRLEELTAVVRTAIKNGRISFDSAVRNLAELPRSEQETALEKLLESAPRTESGRAPAGSNSGGTRKVTVSPVSRFRKLFMSEEAMDALSARERALIEWGFGKLSVKELGEHNPKLAGVVEAMGKKRGDGNKKGKVGKSGKASKSSETEAAASLN